MEALKGEIKMENELMNNVPTVEPVVEPVVTEDPEVTNVEVNVTVEDEIIDQVDFSVRPAVVSGAKKLNVRKEPVKDAEVVCVLAEGTSLQVWPDESTADFYKIFTEVNNVTVEGYCVKSFIALK